MKFIDHETSQRQKGAFNMQKMNKTKRNIAIIMLVITGLLISFVQANAGLFEDRTFHAPDLFYASPQLATPGEVISFYINTNEYYSIGLQHPPIAYVEWNFGDGSLPYVTSDLESVSHIYQSAGQYEAMATIYLRKYRSAGVEYIIEAPVTVQVGLTTENSARGIANSESVLFSFDIDGNDVIEDEEMFLLIDAWVRGQLSDEIFFTAVDLWVMRSSIQAISSSSLSFSPQVTRSAGGSMVFAAGRANLGPTTLRIFDTSGQLVALQQSSNSTLRWNLTSTNGTAVANGTYFYSMTSVDSAGRTLHSAPQAIVVLR